MTLAECGELKKRLVGEKDLYKVQDYFFSFAEQGTLLTMGRPFDGERATKLLNVVSQACSRALNLAAVRVEAGLIEVGEYQMIHGPLTVNGKQGSLLYFEDIGTGLLTLLWDASKSGTKYLRFMTQAPGTAKPN